LPQQLTESDLTPALVCLGLWHNRKRILSSKRRNL